MRRLLVFTSARSDYGILRPLLNLIQADDSFTLGVFVTGTHLDEAHGRTVQEIEADGFPIVARAPILSDDDSWVGSAFLTSRAIDTSAKVLDSWQPDLALVLGDRVEALGFAIACHYSQTPLAHLHGGEVTEGAIDDSCRHAITKFASLHLPAAEEFAQRIVQLGEDPARVHVVGALGLDSILEDRSTIEASPRNTGRVLVTYHPATAGDEGALDAAEAILQASVRTAPSEVLVTLPNADHGSALVREAIARVSELHPGKIRAVKSLGATGFHTEAYGAVAVVGNSSAGIIEAPFLGTPTVNVGIRQQGRPKAASVADVPIDIEAIAAAIEAAKIQKTTLMPFAETVYGNGRSAEKTLIQLKSFQAGRGNAKSFYDLP